MQLYRADGLWDASVGGSKILLAQGIGSLGSSVVSQLAYPWKKIVLFDPDVLKEANIERHHLGRSYLRWNKAEAERDWLIKEKGVPADRVVAYAGDDSLVFGKWTNASVLICSVDDPTARKRANQWTQANHIPAIYGGVFAKGAGGFVFSLPDPTDVCYICADHERGDKKPPGPVTHDYGVDPSRINVVDGVPQAVSALSKNVTAIGNDMAFAVWQLLFSNDNRAIYRKRGLDAWVPATLVHSKSEEFKSLVLALKLNADLGLEPTVRFGKADKEGYFPVEIRQNYWPRYLTRWDSCPHHGQLHKISDM